MDTLKKWFTISLKFGNRQFGNRQFEFFVGFGWVLVALFLLALAFCGCGDDVPAEQPEHSSTTGGVCYQEADWVFHADICPNRTDIGTCSWDLPDGRTLHPSGCITQRGVTCVEDCSKVR